MRTDFDTRARPLPSWLAPLTLWMNRGTPDARARLRAFAERAHVLSPLAWQRTRWRIERACVLEAIAHVPTGDEWGVRAAGERVVMALDHAILSGALAEELPLRGATSARSARIGMPQAPGAPLTADYSAAEAVEWGGATGFPAEAAWWATQASVEEESAQESAARLAAEILGILEDECKSAEARVSG